jgi:hypothetical protein
MSNAGPPPRPGPEIFGNFWKYLEAFGSIWKFLEVFGEFFEIVDF